MRLLFILFFVFGGFYVHAFPVQNAKIQPLAIQIKKDSSKIDLRKFDQGAIEKFSKQKAFIYEDIAPENLSLWRRFWIWIGKLLSQIFSNSTSGNILKYVLIAIVIILIVWITLKLSGIDFKLFAKKAKEIEIAFEEGQENIYKINFDEQLEKAIQAKNYRLAVRLLYLKSLKHLSDHRLIDWQLDKTNRTYIAELKNEHHREEFEKLTLQFEYTWYGDFVLNQQQFEPIHQSFHHFNSHTR